MHRGYIKLWRKIMEWEWYKDSHTLHLFLHLLINANYKSSRFMGIEISRGQIVTGRKKLCEDTGISEQSLRTAVNKLKSTSEITIVSTNKFTIITLCNYEIYQELIDGANQADSQLVNQRLTNDQPTTNQRLTTSKELKNDNKEKNDKNNTDVLDKVESSWRTSFPLYKEILDQSYTLLVNDSVELEKQERLNPNVDILLSLEKAVHNFWGTEAGWKHKKKSRTKDIDMRSTLINALSMSSNKVYKPRPVTQGRIIHEYERKAAGKYDNL